MKQLALLIIVACGGSQPTAAYNPGGPSAPTSPGDGTAIASPFVPAYPGDGTPVAPPPLPGDPVAPPRLTCNDGFSLTCSRGIDGCLLGKTLYHACIEPDASPGPSCAQAIAIVCPADQADACLWTPAAATSHMCVYRGR